MQEALNAAKTINQERTRSDIIRIMLNHNEDGIIAIDNEDHILAINNQAYRVFQLSTVGELTGQPVSAVYPSGEWDRLLEKGSEKEQIISLHDKKYYVQYKPLSEAEAGAGALIFIKNTDRIMEEESRIRRGLSEKGADGQIYL